MFLALLPTYPPFPFPLVRGKGDCVFDDRGRRFFDFYGGHCVCSTGHAHPTVAAAITRQANELLFYSTAAEIPMRNEAAEAMRSVSAISCSQNCVRTSPNRMQIDAVILGASGYGGGELLRWLSQHPNVARMRGTSRSLAGRPFAEAHPNLRGLVAGSFEAAIDWSAHPETKQLVVFSALPHGELAKSIRGLEAEWSAATVADACC